MVGPGHPRALRLVRRSKSTATASALRSKLADSILWCMASTEGRRSQLLRGVLDLCLLAVMGDGPAYGYEMTKRLRARGLSIVGEGSIYPLLGRLERDGLVETRRAASNGGPPRKYYSLSPEVSGRWRSVSANGRRHVTPLMVRSVWSKRR